MTRSRVLETYRGLMILWDITWLLRALSENANRVTASTYLLVLWMTSIFCWSLRPNGLLMGHHKILVYNWCFQVLCYLEYRIFPIEISWLRQICFFAPNAYNAHHRIWDHCNIITQDFFIIIRKWQQCNTTKSKCSPLLLHPFWNHQWSL